MAKESKDFQQFIRDSEVQQLITELRDRLSIDGQMPVFSDLIKEENGTRYQYVNYVQEGGGVLGIGLVGYTYVLECLGIRFLKLAGTSAGSVNTLMLAAVDIDHYNAGETQEKFKLKSEIILHEMLNYDFWKLVDGNWFTKALIRLFINSRLGTRLLQWILICAVVVPLLYASFSIVIRFIFIQSAFTAIRRLSTFLSIFTAIFLGILLLAVILTIGFFALFSKQGYGINPGKNLHQWMEDILEKNGVRTALDLEELMYQGIQDISLRPHRPIMNDQGDTTQIDPPYLTIVASDITNQTKVEFPLMTKDYWQDPDHVNPADFVRASMSIPIFFEPFKVTVHQQVKKTSTLQKLKQDVHRMHEREYEVSFVDGGILSNFPINVFHNPKIKIARCPTFGVKLEDDEHITGTMAKIKKIKLTTFLWNIYNTVRFYYDRDFLKKNEIYEKCIAHIDVAGFNWLNFGLDYNTKLKLFKKGAEAAKTFFLGGKIWVDGKEKLFEPFDWEKFKKERETVVTAQNG